MSELTYHQSEPLLNERQARVLGSLMEKQLATPDYYPLTVNALLAACNQKSSRNPVMSLTNEDLGNTLNELRREGLVTANTLGRADRFEQQLSRKLSLSSKERAIICVMLLRGAHTLNEIKVNTARMVDFADHETIMQNLQTLMDREEPLIALIPKSHGQREDRYTHLLCGKPEIELQVVRKTVSSPKVADDTLARISQLEETVARLEEEVRALKEGKTSAYL